MVGAYSVGQAAQRLDCSEATIRRDVERGVLAAVSGSKPLLLTVASVDQAVETKLKRMGVELQPPPSAADQAAHVAKLERDLEELKGALADLTAAHSAVLDTYRRLSSGGVPNN
jgi:DNA-directed RNA polymerase specialized sigma24 family protein